MFKCAFCQMTKEDTDLGIQILNKTLESVPPEITICSECTTDMAVSLLTGSIDFKAITKIFKMIRGVQQ